MKEKFENIKELNDSKTSSIIKLSLWLIIIIILAVFMRINQPKNEKQPVQEIKQQDITPTDDKILEQLKNITSYEEDITVETDIIENIKITHANNDDLIIYNNQQYYKSADSFFIDGVTDNSVLYDVIRFNIDYIKNILENTYEDYLTVYKDNSYVISYTVSLNDIGNINVLISGKESINKIEINFENYSVKRMVFDLENINNIEIIDVNMEVN